MLSIFKSPIFVCLCSNFSDQSRKNSSQISRRVGRQTAQVGRLKGYLPLNDNAHPLNMMRKTSTTPRNIQYSIIYLITSKEILSSLTISPNSDSLSCFSPMNISETPSSLSKFYAQTRLYLRMYLKEGTSKTSSYPINFQQELQNSSDQ